ncbi:peptidoglycan-binding domain-containing protein [Rhizobium leguminosarum]|uniref:peptidoglycan-binding domain-containing protein n=1 Tax=Rhizobium leguminosarum TaxID=384 RepID=UPI003F95B9CC
MQSGLKAYGYYALTGVADGNTRAALSQMQKENSLKVTGTITTEALDAFGIVVR